jgi:hypothetical protein
MEGIYKPKDGVVRILPNISSGIETTVGPYYIRKTTKTNEEIILDTLDFGVIERYVRKKKLEKLNKL